MNLDQNADTLFVPFLSIPGDGLTIDLRPSARNRGLFVGSVTLTLEPFELEPLSMVVGLTVELQTENDGVERAQVYDVSATLRSRSGPAVEAVNCARRDAWATYEFRSYGGGRWGRPCWHPEDFRGAIIDFELKVQSSEEFAQPKILAGGLAVAFHPPSPETVIPPNPRARRTDH